MSARNELPLPAPLLIDEEQLLAEMPSPGAADLRFTQSHQRAQTQTYLASNLQQGTGRAHQQAPQMNFCSVSVACSIMNGLLKKSMVLLSARKGVYCE